MGKTWDEERSEDMYIYFAVVFISTFVVLKIQSKQMAQC